MQPVQQVVGADDVLRRTDSEHGQAAHLDEMLAQATEAAHGLTAENAAREARAEYAARLRREASAEPEHMAQPQASYEAEIEL